MSVPERTRDLYEAVGGYPAPPLLPLPGPEDLDSLERMGLVPGSTSRRLVRAAMRATGFDTFLEELPRTAEGFLRTHNARLPGLCGPAMGATLALEDDPRGLPPLQRAATLLLAARELYDDLVAGRLPPEARGVLTEMGQWPNLFGTSLVVEGGTPRLFKCAHPARLSVSVARRLYSLPVAPLGTELGVEALEASLAALVQTSRDAGRAAQAPAAGLLTCASDGTQLDLFRELEKRPVNRHSLALLRQGFLTLCLDLDHHPATDAEAAFLAQSGNCGNRWFHSSLQLVVFGNGKACLICNFAAYLDGNTMMRAGSELWRRASGCRVGTQAVGSALPPAEELRWELAPGMLRRATRELRLMLDNQQATFELPGLGRRVFAERGLAPVPAFTLAVQMAARRLTGRTPSTTQLLGRARYRCMGITTASVTTPEVARFLESMDAALLEEALASHRRECRQERDRLALPVVFPWFVESQPGWRRRYVLLVAGVLLRSLRKRGLLRSTEPDIILSHPDIHPGVSVVGRPGTRITQARCFGLHYQLMEERTVLTLMPAALWPVPNVELVEELRGCLARLLEWARPGQQSVADTSRVTARV